MTDIREETRAPQTETAAPEKQKSALGRFWRLCPVRHVLALVGGAVIGLYFLLRGNYALMQALSTGLVRPYHRAAGRLCALAPFSVAELLYALLVLFVLAYLIRAVWLLLRRPGRLRRLWLTVETLGTAALCIYAGFCLLWGVYYYGESFSQSVGIQTRPISAQELYVVSAWFAEKANHYGELVERDENGLYAGDRQAVLDKAVDLYDQVQEGFPYLEGLHLRPKGILCSRIMSSLNFSGFFFPFTGEANLNMDSPACFLASTAAHELAHQRGVATEQEANFAAVLASLENGDADYCYSAALLAYVHLGNALYSADRELWSQVSGSLSEPVWADLRSNNVYWEQFESKVSEASETVYTGFLQSYGQTLGMKSYGACIDLLIAYYKDAAAAAMEG